MGVGLVAISAFRSANTGASRGPAYSTSPPPGTDQPRLSPGPTHETLATALSTEPVTRSAPPLQALQAPTAPTIDTIFNIVSGQPVTITWPGTPGTSVEFQDSTDLLTWRALQMVMGDQSGRASYTFTPTETAYYRAYFPDGATYGQTVRGVVMQQPGWAGYVVGNGPISYATGSFTVPTIRRSASRTDVAEWVGIGGFAPGDPLIQAGAWETFDPAAGATDVYAWWELWPSLPAQRVPVPVAEGDTLSVTIRQTSEARWAIEIVNTTQGKGYPTEVSYAGAAASAEWIVEAPIDAATGAQLSLADFSVPVSFSQIGFTGSGTSTLPLYMYDRATGARRTVPSALSSNGQSFTVNDLTGNP